MNKKLDDLKNEIKKIQSEGFTKQEYEQFEKRRW